MTNRFATALLIFTVGCFSSSDEITPDDDDSTGPEDSTGTPVTTSPLPTTSGDTSADSTGPGDDDDDDDDNTSDDDDDDDDDDETDSTTGEPQCPMGGPCIPDAPPMWDGPFLVRSDSSGKTPLCPPGTNELAAGGLPPLTADPLDCMCVADAVECPAIVTVLASDETDCTLAEETPLAVGNEACGDTQVFLGTLGFEGGPGSCDEPVVAAPAPTPPTWSENATVCGVANLLECDVGVCGPPEGADGSSCVVRTGLHECPPGPYSEQFQLFSDVEDTRDCSGCTTAPDCGVVHVYDDDGCQGVPYLTWDVITDDGACVPWEGTLDTPPETAQWSGTAECAVVTDTVPLGDVTPTDPFTVCCLP